MRIENKEVRDLYTEECAKSGWSFRQLDRRINSFFYERLLSSQDKKSVSDEIQTLEPKPEYDIKDTNNRFIIQLEYIKEFEFKIYK